MLRVLQVVTHMNRGGLETMIMNYYRQIDRSKVQFDFLVHRQERADYDDEIESLGGTIFRLPYLNPFSPKYLSELNRFFTEHPEYQVVHSHLDCLSAIPLKAAKTAGVPVRIAHSHSSNQDKNLKYLLKLCYKPQIFAAATKLLACSEAAGDWMFGKHSYELLPNAINAVDYIFSSKRRKKVRYEFGIGDNVVFGHVGRFNYPKNHKFLIDIFAEIQHKVPDAKLLLIGGGEGVSEIQIKVKSLNLDNHVIFTGVRSDVADLLQVMDVFIFPSLYEGLPVAMIEAQASGLPCLISDKVPLECKKTDLVQQISLNASPTVWADAAINAAQIKRRNTFEEIKTVGFDIQENAKRLQEFYLGAAAGEKDLCLY